MLNSKLLGALYLLVLNLVVSSTTLQAQTAPIDPANITLVPEQKFQISAATDEPIIPVPLNSDYGAAYQTYASGRAGAAIGPFTTFLSSNPDIASKAEAQFWLGKSYSDSGKSLNAMQHYFDSFKNDPKGRYAPLALLNLGSLLYAADKVSDACFVWDQLETEFATDEFISIRIVGADRRQRYNCPNKTTNVKFALSDFYASDPSVAPEAIAAYGAGANAIPGWQLLQIDNMLVAASDPVFKFAQPGRNCSSNQRSNIYVVMPDSDFLYSQDLVFSDAQKITFFRKLSQIYGPLQAISPPQCHGVFELKIIRQSEASKCFYSNAPCEFSPYLMPNQTYIGLCRDGNGYSIGGSCFSGYDVIVTDISSSNLSIDSMGISIGPVTQRRRVVAIANKEDAEDKALSNALAKSAELKKAKNSEILKSMPTMHREKASILLDQLFDQNTGQCFRVIDASNGGTSIMDCKGFFIKDSQNLALSNADYANGISERARMTIGYIWLSTNAGWVDGSICRNMLRRQTGWVIVGGEC